MSYHPSVTGRRCPHCGTFAALLPCGDETELHFTYMERGNDRDFLVFCVLAPLHKGSPKPPANTQEQAPRPATTTSTHPAHPPPKGISIDRALHQTPLRSRDPYPTKPTPWQLRFSDSVFSRTSTSCKPSHIQESPYTSKMATSHTHAWS